MKKIFAMLLVLAMVLSMVACADTNTNPTTDVAIIDITPAKVYCSVKSEDPEARAIVYNAINSPTVKISDHVGQIIEIKDVYVEEINTTDKDTGEPRKLMKTVLIDPEGNSYFSVARGVYHALVGLIKVFGYPTYTTPVRVRVTEVKLRKGSTYGFEIVR